MKWLAKNITIKASNATHRPQPKTLVDNQEFAAGPNSGRPSSTISIRKLLNAMHVTRGSIAWHLLPLDFPPWQTVYGHFRHLDAPSMTRCVTVYGAKQAMIEKITAELLTGAVKRR